MLGNSNARKILIPSCPMQPAVFKYAPTIGLTMDLTYDGCIHHVA